MYHLDHFLRGQPIQYIMKTGSRGNEFVWRTTIRFKYLCDSEALVGPLAAKVQSGVTAGDSADI